jgi:hypothetical protein
VYNRDLYSQIESYLQDLGHEDKADELYIRMMERDREERVDFLSFDWSRSFALQYLIGFGRRPEQIIYAVVLFIVIGWIVFRKQSGMALKNENDSRRYHPFWYSADLLIPGIDLQAASVWKPTQERRWAWHYARLHRFLGWIIIPIGLAAVIGLIG